MNKLRENNTNETFRANYQIKIHRNWDMICHRLEKVPRKGTCFKFQKRNLH